MDFKLGMDRRLRAALEREEFILHYQPVVEPVTRRVLGVEALLRWQDGANGWISPADFVPVAEETGLMTLIGTWVLKNACRQLKSWIDAGLPPLRMAVNVSRCQLERGDLAAEVERALLETSLTPPSWASRSASGARCAASPEPRRASQAQGPGGQGGVDRNRSIRDRLPERSRWTVSRSTARS